MPENIAGASMALLAFRQARIDSDKAELVVYSRHPILGYDLASSKPHVNN